MIAKFLTEFSRITPADTTGIIVFGITITILLVLFINISMIRMARSDDTAQSEPTDQTAVTINQSPDTDTTDSSDESNIQL